MPLFDRAVSHGPARDAVTRRALRRRVKRAALQVEIHDSLAAVRREWTAVSATSPSVFATWEWADVWWRHFGDDRPLRIAVCRDRDSRVRGILPLYESRRRPVRLYRFIGHGPADELGAICARPDREEVAATLPHALSVLTPGIVLAEMMSPGEGWAEAFGARVVNRQASPVLRIGGRSWDEYLAGLSSNLRGQIRRLERKLVREHEITYRLAVPGPRLESDLDRLFALHSARWPGTRSPFASDHRSFHRHFARVAAHRGWLRLWFMESHERPLACWMGFRRNAVESYFQAGRDVTFQGPSVGLVLLAHSIRSAIGAGMHEYRFLRGDEPFKYRFADSDPGLITAVAGNRAPLQMGVAAATRVPAPALEAAGRRLMR